MKKRLINGVLSFGMAITMIIGSTLTANAYNIAGNMTFDAGVIYAENEETEIVRYGSDSIYTDGTKLEMVKEFTSPDGSILVRVLKDTNGRTFYTVIKDGKCMIQASRLGINCEGADFTTGVCIVDVKEAVAVTDEYVLYNGKHDGSISDTCNELVFALEKDGKKVTVAIRAYNDGMCYQYRMDEGASVINEASEYVFADEAVMWSYAQPNVTYEGTYQEIKMEKLYGVTATYTTPSLIAVDSSFVLITEASVFDDEENYCSSYFKTEKDSKNIKWTFGNKQAGKVTMNGAFETPWRVAVIGDLNTVYNSDIVTSVCEPAKEADYSYVKPGMLAWSWWSSTGDNPIAYEPQFEYIDFAAENGWEYVCLDYGWVLWDDYKEKVKELVNYANEKNVGIWLWYGVNNVGHSAAGAYPKYSLLDEQTIRTEMEWAKSIGIRGVKVDYYESDNQNTMNQMGLCAKICAENEIMVLFHGCTNPGGENRTYPNVLSYEAIYGAEYYKWRTEPSAANIITYLFTRNAIGSADFTPTALPVAGTAATHGFMLATTVYIESGVVHYAENVNVYEGYEGLSIMNDIPATWDESIVISGYSGKYGTVARRSGDEWYIASLTTTQSTQSVELTFLEDGREYTAYIYKTKSDRSGLEIVEKKVSKNDILEIELANVDGALVKITSNQYETFTSYEKENIYMEAEKADMQGNTVLSSNPNAAQYSSGSQLVEYIGGDYESAVLFNVTVETDGIYELGVHYVSGNDRRYMISVNGDDDNRIRTGILNSGDWVSVKKEKIYIKLDKGENTIRFYNTETYAPNLDRISISRTTVQMDATISDETEDEIETQVGDGLEYSIYEAENASIGAGATNEGTLVGWIGGSSYVTFNNIKVEKAGTYYLQIQYMTAEDRDFEVSVNGNEAIIAKCPSSGDYYSNPSSVYIEVELKSGMNEIKLSNSYSNAPNLDKIGISVERIDEDDSKDAGFNDDTDEEKANRDFSVAIIIIIVIVVIAIAAILIMWLSHTVSRKNKRS